MQFPKTALSAAVLLVSALAGCSGGGESGGFSVKGEGLTYTFTANGNADNYTWDLGDHLTRAYTKSVTHTYDFENGVVPVVLVTKNGDVRAEHRKEIVLGTGQNQNAGFVLEGERNWTITGEQVTFSAHRSTDPDGDPLRYTWSCQFAKEAVRQPAHTHSGTQGVPFASAPAGAVVAVIAQGPLPEPDRVVEGDLCDSLGQGGRPSLDTTITGTFTRSGVYNIYLLASDPVHPTTSGKFEIVVTPPGERPEEKWTRTFEGAFLGGAGGGLQEACGLAQEQCNRTFDSQTFTFSLPLGGQEGYLSLDYSDPTGGMGIACELSRAGTTVATATGPGANETIAPQNLAAGGYSILCEPAVAVPTGPDGVPYTVSIFVDLDMDPFKVY